MKEGAFQMSVGQRHSAANVQAAARWPPSQESHPQHSHAVEHGLACCLALLELDLGACREERGGGTGGAVSEGAGQQAARGRSSWQFDAAGPDRDMSSQHVSHASIDFNAASDAHASIQLIVPGWMRSGFVTSGFSSCRASRVVPSACSAPGQGGAEQPVKGGNSVGGAACRPQVV